MSEIIKNRRHAAADLADIRFDDGNEIEVAVVTGWVGPIRDVVDVGKSRKAAGKNDESNDVRRAISRKHQYLHSTVLE